jgi:ribosome maturation factor RimP
MTDIDEKRLIDLNKGIQDIGEYAMACQKIMAWYQIYFEKHKQLNQTQHNFVRLETDKEIGIDIEQLNQEHNQLSKQLTNEGK